MSETYARYVEWLRATPENALFPKLPNGQHDLKAVGATIPDDIALAALDEVDEFLDRPENAEIAEVFRVYKAVHREFTNGWRCGVCGRNDDPTYDHAREC